MTKHTSMRKKSLFVIGKQPCFMEQMRILCRRTAYFVGKTAFSRREKLHFLCETLPLPVGKQPFPLKIPTNPLLESIGTY